MEALLAVLQPHGPSRPVAQQGGRRGRQPQVREGRDASSLGLPGAGLMAKRGEGGLPGISLSLTLRSGASVLRFFSFFFTDTLSLFGL